MNIIIVTMFCAACIFTGWLYFRRFQLSRPPVGVFNLRDIAILFVFIIFVPLMYLVFPSWGVFALLALSTLSIAYSVFEPILLNRWYIGSAALLLIALNLLSAHLFGTQSNLHFLFNNITFTVSVVGIANLWAQTGIKARDVAILSALLMGYDFVFTTQLSVMEDMFNRLHTLPLAPLLAWHSQEGTLMIGLGDLLIATVFPLAICKGYSRNAGVSAMLINFSVIVALPLLPIREIFPVMTLLSPAVILQYIYWRYRYGIEGTMHQYQVNYKQSKVVSA
jgi:hypothetical protein